MPAAGAAGAGAGTACGLGRGSSRVRGGDYAGIQAREDAFRAAADQRDAVYAAAMLVSGILLHIPRRMTGAHVVYAQAYAALHEEMTVPPRPAPPVTRDMPAGPAVPAGPAGAIAPAAGPVQDTGRGSTGAGHDAGGDVIEQIRRLGDLHTAGLITTGEFETTKTALLGRLQL